MLAQALAVDFEHPHVNVVRAFKGVRELAVLQQKAPRCNGRLMPLAAIVDMAALRQGQQKCIAIRIGAVACAHVLDGRCLQARDFQLRHRQALQLPVKVVNIGNIHRQPVIR